MIPFEPMLARPGELPTTDDGWVYEFKWDGIRCVAHAIDGSTKLFSRNGNNFTVSYPELHRLCDDLPPDTVLDGEIVTLDERGRPDFGLLQHRIHQADPRRAISLVSTQPVMLFVFDLLRLDGHDMTSLVWADRRRVLESLELAGPSWRVPPYFEHDGAATFDAVSALGLEGLVAKRSNSAYEPGVRSAHWRKIKRIRSDEFVVGGWTYGSGRRSGLIGSLLLGAWNDAGELQFVGAAGSGLADAESSELITLLGPSTEVDPFGAGPTRPAAVFVEPTTVVQVQYHQWTREGVLRHPSYIGRRVNRQSHQVRLSDM